MEGPKRGVMPPERTRSAAGFHGRKGVVGRTTLHSRYQAPSGPTKAWTVDSAYHNASALLDRSGMRAESQGKQIPESVNSGLVVTSARIVRLQILLPCTG